MFQADRLAGSGALGRFTARFRDDAGFHTLVRTNTREALAAAGIRVPNGVQVSFAPDVSTALNMALDGPPQPALDNPELDDSALEVVVGGTGAAGRDDEIRQFLELFRLKRA